MKIYTIKDKMDASLLRRDSSLIECIETLLKKESG